MWYVYNKEWCTFFEGRHSLSYSLCLINIYSINKLKRIFFVTLRRLTEWMPLGKEKWFKVIWL